MKNCPSCAQPLGDHDVVCHACGRAVSHDAMAAGHVRADQQEHPRVPRVAGEPLAQGKRGPFAGLMPVAVVGGVGAVILLLVMGGLLGRGSAAGSAGSKADTGAGAVAVPTPANARLTAPVMKWNQVKQSPWGRDGLRTVAFELPAEGDVPVWMKRVRPLLVVRCLSRNTEVFVVTSSAASFERNSGRHTVHVGFDGSTETAEEWEDSVDSQQLFAPDGVGLARRIAEARTMTFRFTPFNASPVTAEFNVAGFHEHLEDVAKTCRWRP